MIKNLRDATSESFSGFVGIGGTGNQCFGSIGRPYNYDDEYEEEYTEEDYWRDIYMDNFD